MTSEVPLPEADPRAFEQLYAELAPRLRRLCVALIGRAEAEDLMQEVLLKLHCASLAPGSSVLGWSLAVARTSWIDRMRRRRRRPEVALAHEQLEDLLAADSSCPERSLRHAALEEALEKQLLALSESLRTAFVLVKIDGLSCCEASQQLGTSLSATKQRVHRAAEELRQALHEAGWSAF